MQPLNGICGGDAWEACELVHDDSQGCHADRPISRHVRLLVRSDRAHVSDMTVNGMLTSDRVKPELLCPRWLPHRCHVGFSAIML